MKKKTSKKKPINKKLRVQRIFATVLTSFLVLAITVTTITGIYINGEIKDANSKNITASTFTSQDSTKIFYADEDGEWVEFFNAGEAIRDNVIYEDLPEVLIDAFIATEDSRFFEHNGWDFPRFVSAMTNNLVNTLKTGSLNMGQGGSTFDMQLVKNKLFMTDEVTGEEAPAASGVSGIGRKIQEIYLAQKIEKEGILTKKEIFENYLNTINFGVPNNIRGIKDSAEVYFGKDLGNLNLVESAFLAGVINGPNRYSPFYSIEKAKQRTHSVLKLMLMHGYISQEEFQLAENVDLENLFAYDTTLKERSHQYQAFVDMVLDEAQEITGIDPVLEPMNIYTTMNPRVQAAIDKVQNREFSEMDPHTIYADSVMQFGGGVVDNKTGAIIGIAGGYDYGTTGQRLFVRGTSALHQPGSVIKPMVDYALLFDQLGYATSHVLLDHPMNHAGTDLEINNWDNKFKGDISIMEAIADSRNTTAMDALTTLLDTFGSDYVNTYLNNIGFKHYEKSNLEPQFAIGGGDFEVTPIELAISAAPAFNGGFGVKAHSISRIEFSKQSNKEDYVFKDESVQALSDAGAYLASRAFYHAANDVYPGNSSMSRVRRSYPVFGKTGTNIWDTKSAQNYGIKPGSVRDRLMVTSRHDYSIGVWTGFDKYSADIKPWFTSAENNFNITAKFNSYMLDILESEYGKGKDIPKPASVAEITHIQGTYPYQAPLPGMNEDLIVTGLIRKDKLNLVQATPQELDPLSDQKVAVTQKGKDLEFKVDMSAYPDPQKLIEAKKDDKDLGNGVFGRRMYDDSWLYGPVRYKTEIRLDGNVVYELVTEEQNQSFKYTLNQKFNTMEICSYYTFSLSNDLKSNIICSKAEVSNDVIDQVTVGNWINRKLSDTMDWFDQHVNNVSIQWALQDNIKSFSLVKGISPQIIGKSFTKDELDKMDIVLQVHDFSTALGQTYKLSDLKQAATLGNIELVTSGDANKKLTAIKLNDDNTPHTRWSNFIGKKLELIFEP